MPYMTASSCAAASHRSARPACQPCFRWQLSSWLAPSSQPQVMGLNPIASPFQQELRFQGKRCWLHGAFMHV